MSLPDIEAFIEQKLPVARVEADLLVARPRKPREVPADGEVVEEESIGAIFKEAREQKAADDERRGGGRAGSGGSRAGGGRSEGGSRAAPPRRAPAGAGAAPHAPRPPRAAAEQAANEQASSAAVAMTPVAPATEGEHAPRKPRRRRGGRRIDGADVAAPASASASASAIPAGSNTVPGKATQVMASKPAPRPDAQATPGAPAANATPGLLGRLGRGLKSLVTRAPRSQH